MRQAERLAALGTLAAGMAHEIRNPLSAIKTFVQLLPRKIDKPGFLEKFNRTVPRELNRINDLVEDLLDLARVPKYDFRSIQIQTLIHEALETVGEDLKAHNILVRFEPLEHLPPVRADAGQLSKAFHNLIRNAVQAMPDGGELRIEPLLNSDQQPESDAAPERAESIAVAFQDTGQGIPPDELKNIFNPFFTTKMKGTGLGLSITHKVVTEHGGTITVTSQADQGARFVIHLPV
jgi:signal transduction histidine kinase